MSCSLFLIESVRSIHKICWKHLTLWFLPSVKDLWMGTFGSPVVDSITDISNRTFRLNELTVYNNSDQNVL